MSVKDIKEEADNLPKVMDLLRLFDESQHNVLLPHTREHVHFRKKFDKKDTEQLNSFIFKKQEIMHDLFESQVNDKMQTLAYNLKLLKVSTISKDYKQSKRIMQKFLRQEDICLSKLIDKNEQFAAKVEEFRKNYHELHSFVTKKHVLEKRSEIKFANKHLSSLHELSVEQKRLLKVIGSEFSKISKELLKDKGFKSSFVK